MLLKQDLLATCSLWTLSSPTSAGRATSSAREKPRSTLSACQISHGLKLLTLVKVSACSPGSLALEGWFLSEEAVRVVLLSRSQGGGCSGCPYLVFAVTLELLQSISPPQSFLSFICQLCFVMPGTRGKSPCSVEGPLLHPRGGCSHRAPCKQPIPPWDGARADLVL